MVGKLMRWRFQRVVGVCAALVLGNVAGCGGKHETAKAPEVNPWADYKGTYAGASEARTAEPVKPKASSSTDAKAMAGTVAGESKPDEEAAAAAAPPKKAVAKKHPKGVVKKAPKGT